MADGSYPGGDKKWGAVANFVDQELQITNQFLQFGDMNIG